MSAIDHYINAILVQGRAEALADGSAAIEPHHLLLAIASVEENAARQALTAEGLDRQAIKDALDREFERSLSLAGVSLASFGLPTSTPDPKRSVNMGASTKLALDRAIAAATGKKDLRPGHLLLGILQAEVGTVPRALALAGVDRPALMASVEQALANGSW
ncbi:Clp protease N-terminal domain-containing protein [Nonomuraea sp. CA-141351]|uniref:Clp protease N-terminal domain-containing protein n=1 Tax=Nonomuraea sp. CA-141351 TaxID=3239996 RepID=UPI003D8F2D8E